MHVPLIWEKAWPLLRKAVDRFPHIRGRRSEAKILNDLAHHRAQLWVAWDIETNDCVGAILTEITTSADHPDKCFMEIPLVGGTEFRGWIFAIWRLLKEWGRSNGCTHAIGYGRKGWVKLLGFDEHGKSPSGILIMVYDLKEH